MGNWRRVHIKGKCDPKDIPALKEYLDAWKRKEYGICGPLHGGGICGLSNWAGEEINKVGNLFERDYSVEDIHNELLRISGIVPSLYLVVHCGEDHEGDECIATVCLSRRHASTHKPEVEKIPNLDKKTMHDNMIEQLKQ